jgi:hypothetical protein
MSKLSTDVKRFIVTQLACFEAPSDIQKALKLLDPPVELTTAGIVYYDPNSAAGSKDLAAEWRTLFEDTRREFSKELAGIAIAQQGWRLRRYQHLHDRALTAGNLVLAATLLQQAAEDVGGKYTNRQELTGRNGAPLMPTGAAPLTETERQKRVDTLLAKAMARAGADDRKN